MSVDENLNVPELLQQVVLLLPRFAYRMSDEMLFQEGLGHVLTQAGTLAHRKAVVAGRGAGTS